MSIVNQFLMLFMCVLSTVQNLMGADPEILYTRLEKIGKGSFGEVFKGYENSLTYFILMMSILCCVCMLVHFYACTCISMMCICVCDVHIHTFLNIAVGHLV